MTSANGLPTIKTFTGLTFDFVKPTARMIAIEDIAHALSNICRFGGQAREFYSVAQHSMLVSQLLGSYGRTMQRHGLLHDATEAYVGDMVKPLKNLLPGYQMIEGNVWVAIKWALGIEETLEAADLVKWADRQALAIEGDIYMVGRHDEYGIMENTNLAIEMRRWACKPFAPVNAERFFLDRFHQLTPP